MDREPDDRPETAGPAPSPDDVVPEKHDGVLSTLRAVRKALAPIGRRRLLRTVLVISFFLILGGTAFAGFSMWWTSQPSFCGRCHVMDKYIDAWEDSQHAGVNCERCHAPTGTFGFLGGKVSALQVVVNYFRGNYEDTSFNAAVPNANCLQCHGKILTDEVETDEIRVSHEKIVEKGGKCMFCHSAVAHGSAVPFGSHTEPTMDACFKCHNEDMAPLECEICHRESPLGPTPEDHGDDSAAPTTGGP